ncbi:hypothetical protein B0H13DRAFT_2313717 [Mycena leptocephala]|nr:hypothetical protein B0H13DRAFT_2313717 [Mycena leptocephala]
MLGISSTQLRDQALTHPRSAVLQISDDTILVSRALDSRGRRCQLGRDPLKPPLSWRNRLRSTEILRVATQATVLPKTPALLVRRHWTCGWTTIGFPPSTPTLDLDAVFTVLGGLPPTRRPLPSSPLSSHANSGHGLELTLRAQPLHLCRNASAQEARERLCHPTLTPPVDRPRGSGPHAQARAGAGLAKTGTLDTQLFQHASGFSSPTPTRGATNLGEGSNWRWRRAARL